MSQAHLRWAAAALTAFSFCSFASAGDSSLAERFNPHLNALFLPLANMCNDYKAVEQPPTPGEDYGRGMPPTMGAWSVASRPST
jgi:hypothetical protein